MASGPSRAARRIAFEVIAVIIGFGLLLWAAEALARNGAETLLQRNIQQVTGVDQVPSVSLGEGFVLPQAIRGHYDQVRVSVSDLRSGPLRLERVDAELSGVRMPLRDLLLRDSRDIVVDDSTDSALLRLDDLNAYFDITGRSVRLDQRSDGSLLMRGTFDVLGTNVEVSGPVELGVDGSQLRVNPTTIDTGTADLSRFERLLLQQRLDLSVPLDSLPFGNQLTAVSIEEGALVLTAVSAGQLVLRP